MADRPKKKQASGVRNDARANGKAPKKNPKPQRTLDPEVKAQRERDREIARQKAADEQVLRQERYMRWAHGEALKMNRAFDANKRRESAVEAAKRLSFANRNK